jgi:predicted ATP-dependent endonuclease of OLD family
MKIRETRIHNFRSLGDLTLALEDYSLLVGQNNTGKTSVLMALRCLYEEGGRSSTRPMISPSSRLRTRNRGSKSTSQLPTKSKKR